MPLTQLIECSSRHIPGNAQVCLEQRMVGTGRTMLECWLLWLSHGALSLSLHSPFEFSTAQGVFLEECKDLFVFLTSLPEVNVRIWRAIFPFPKVDYKLCGSWKSFFSLATTY